MVPSPKVKQIMRELSFDFGSFSIEGFLSWVGQQRNREFVAIPWSMPTGMFGAWISDRDSPREYIFYRDDVPSLHQIHIQLHEVSHFLCSHPTLQVSRNEVDNLLNSGTGSLPLEFVQLRVPFTSEMECEAEYLASLIQEKVLYYSYSIRLTS